MHFDLQEAAVALHMLTKDGANRNYLHNFDHTSLELCQECDQCKQAGRPGIYCNPTDEFGQRPFGYCDTELFTVL
jgi:hypothetical protein